MAKWIRVYPVFEFTGIRFEPIPEDENQLFMFGAPDGEGGCWIEDTGDDEIERTRDE